MSHIWTILALAILVTLFLLYIVTMGKLTVVRARLRIETDHLDALEEYQKELRMENADQLAYIRYLQRLLILSKKNRVVELYDDDRIPFMNFRDWLQASKIPEPEPDLKNAQDFN